MDNADTPYLHFGPYGLYSTFLLMLLAIPFGWIYAYVAHAGYHKDITLPNSERVQAAWGGALLIAIAVFLLRHGVWDINAKEVFAWVHDTVAWLIRMMMDFLIKQFQTANGLLSKLFFLFVLTFAAPAALGLFFIGLFYGGGAVFTGLYTAMIGSGAGVASAIVVAIGCLPGFVMGTVIVLYFLFVRLPLQVVYAQAIREGRWPTTDELVWALSKGTLGLTGWQSDIMAYKARRFTETLNKQADKFRDD
jgi:hypothetical protein